MKPLRDHITDPGFKLDGANLVEASAGTGKTYNIQTLYLRQVIEQGLRVQRILVVTFTEAATKELRDRLRSVLDDALRHLNGQPSAEPRVAEILSRAPLQGDRFHKDDAAKEKKWRIERALLDFDEAAIFTIHGFCQRVLERFAFECRQQTDAELIGDDRSVIHETCEDWWRNNINPSYPLSCATTVSNELSLNRLKSLAVKIIARPDSKIKPGADANFPAESNVLIALQSLIKAWSDSGAAIKEGLKQALSEGFLNSRVVHHIPATLDELQQRKADPFDWLEALISFAKNLDPVKIPVHYELPPPVLEMAKACQAVKSDPNHDDKINHLMAIWKRHKDDILRFLAHDLGHLGSGTRNKFTAEFIKTISAAFDDPHANAKDFKKACDWFTPDKLKPLSERTWKKPAEMSGFYEGCKELEKTLDQWLLGVTMRALAEIRTEHAKRKLHARIKTFDDLLLNLRDSLNQPVTRDALLNSLREEYRVALIDEFQDTDPIQYDIFRSVFIEGGLPVCLVGDPKQSIYAFRGGDVFTYYRAADAVRGRTGDHCFSLDTNYRSEARLVEAVNQIFRDTPGTKTFQEKIDYDGSLNANGIAPDKSLTVTGQTDPQPFKLWLYPNAADAGTSKYSPAAKHLYADTADEIARLLQDDQTRIAGQPIKPSDIAILVMRHDEAAMIRDELDHRGIAAVRQSTGRVFDSPQAIAFYRLLEAFAQPRNIHAVRAALAAGIVDCDDDRLYRMLRDESSPTPASADATASSPDRMEFWLGLFQETHAIWRHLSFIAAFNFFERRARVRPHLIRQPDGERALTNVLHLARLLHEAIIGHHLSVTGALTWFARQLDAETADNNPDDFEMRLESDDNAVQILTVFRSKGLEYPIVFVPTLWQHKADNKFGPAYEYHDRNDEDRHCFDLHKDSKHNEAGHATSIQELLAEDIRLLYVAVTRAKHRVYLVGGDFKNIKPENSALASVLGTGNPPDRLRARLKPGESPAFEMVVKDITKKTESAPSPVAQPAPSPTPLIARPKPVVDKSHGHTSFTGIAPRAGHGESDEDHAYDFDAQDAPPREPIPAETTESLDILGFPAGKRTGECWHRIFELIDFTAPDDIIRPVIDEQVAFYRLDHASTPELQQARRDVVARMVRHTLDARCDTGQTDFSLNQITPDQCRTELAFNFALPAWSNKQPVTTRVIRDVLARHWQNDPSRQPFLDRIQDWDAQIPQGFLTGFVDLVFRHHDRYYVLDWKSNRRTGKPEDFDADGLRAEIATHAYFLQYLIYTVALHQYLAGSGADYNYDKHFGGVFYVFLRATQPGKTNGIYFDRPPLPLITDLSSVLGVFS